MKIFKIQFEVRYNAILNFREVYRSIMGRYAKSEFAIVNENTNSEYIVVKFKKEKYQIDCRWDRIIFLSEGDRSDLDRAQGPLFIFFEILDKLRSQPTFHDITNALITASHLFEVEDTSDNIIKRFKKQYISGVGFDFSNFSQDYSITHEFQREDKTFRIVFGPFNYKTDVGNYNLSPVLQLRGENFKDLKGLYIETLYFEKLSMVNFESFLSMKRKIGENITKIKLDDGNE
jgi:hypothetical protein